MDYLQAPFRLTLNPLLILKLIKKYSFFLATYHNFIDSDTWPNLSMEGHSLNFMKREPCLVLTAAYNLYNEV